MNKSIGDYSLWENENSERRRICMLMITHACNLNCSYCYESHKSNSAMTIEQAKRIITYEAEMVANSSEYDELQIDFMGGEPLMNFTLIKDIVEWLETGVISVPWICFATTNATLLDDKIWYLYWTRSGRRWPSVWMPENGWC